MPESEMPDDTAAIEALRDEMCNIVHRGCRQGLFLGALGTVSLRLGDDDFLVTPRNVVRWNLLPVDMVRVKDGFVLVVCSPTAQLGFIVIFS
jgi:L-fuculose-phosphate aldolase